MFLVTANEKAILQDESTIGKLRHHSSMKYPLNSIKTCITTQIWEINFYEIKTKLGYLGSLRRILRSFYLIMIRKKLLLITDRETWRQNFNLEYISTQIFNISEGYS